MAHRSQSFVLRSHGRKGLRENGTDEFGAEKGERVVGERESDTETS